MFGELLQPGVIFELKMHKKVFGDWAPSGLAGRAYREQLQSRSGPDTLAAPQQGRTGKEKGGERESPPPPIPGSTSAQPYTHRHTMHQG